MTAHFEGAHFRAQRRTGVTLSDARFEGCAFDNCAVRDSRISGVELIDCRCWSCRVNDTLIEDSSVDGLSMTIGRGGGRRQPLLAFGVRFRRVTLRGRIGNLILNRPFPWLQLQSWPAGELDEVRRHYEKVDWALDLVDAAFTAVPAFRFGPPPELVRRDPSTQVIVTRAAARSGEWRSLADLGVWRVVIQDLLDRPWPDSALLVAPRGGARGSLERDLRGLEALRKAGIAT